MNIVVLVAGVLDPKWPVAAPSGELPPPEPERTVMSPFDEAALELALRIQDADPQARSRAIVTGGTRLARAVAASRLGEVATLTLPAPWDQRAVAQALAPACGDADLVLIGREFGDLDDGLVPPLLAAILGRPYFGRVQAVDAAGGVRLLRENGPCEEVLEVGGPLLASVTNDRRSRLRKPLMKNVVAARQAHIAPLVAAPAERSSLALAGVEERADSRAPRNCVFLEGPPEVQAARLGARLVEARA